MSTAVNYCSSDLGAKIVECCSNSANAEGVLSEREDSIWSAKAEGVAEKPFITVQIPAHPAIRFIGWHVWQDYSSNPKVVEVSAGMSPNALTDVVHCTALQGPGIQLWELSTPISSAYSYIRFRVVATFGSSSTYMNRICAFSQRPPEPSTSSAVGINNSSYSPQSRVSNMMNHNTSFSPSRNMTTTMNNTSNFLGGYNNPNNASLSAPGAMYTGGGPSASNPRGFSNSSAFLGGGNSSHDPNMKAFEGGSPMHMSEMLKELDDDIRMLHPLHVEGLVAKTAAAATRTSSISNRPTPTVSPSNQMISDQSYNNNNNNNNNGPLTTSNNNNNNNTNYSSRHNEPPLQHSEIEELRREVAELRGRVNSSSNNRSSISPSAAGGTSTGRGVSFPQEELSTLVDDIMQPKLMKWARKLEGRILMKVDETLKDLLGQITAAIDARVEQHMRHVLREHHREHGIELCHLCGPHHHTHNNNKNHSRSNSGAEIGGGGASFMNTSTRQNNKNSSSSNNNRYNNNDQENDDDDEEGNTHRYRSSNSNNNNNSRRDTVPVAAVPVSSSNRLPPPGSSSRRK